jgi:hypothetical protein
MVLLLSACAHVEPPAEKRILSGQWTNGSVALFIDRNGGSAHWQCAEARFAEALRVGVGGHFLVGGTYERRAGSSRAQPEPANISGRLDKGGILWLDVATARGLAVASQRLTRVRQAEVPACT